jgi:hypothetical protein
MDTTDPTTPSSDSKYLGTKEAIELHVRAYHSALKGASQVTVSSLTNLYQKTQPILHPLAENENVVDTSPLIYSFLRLPSCIDHCQKIIMGQMPEVFADQGYQDVESWPRVTTQARRRIMHYSSSKKTLACFITSISDIDDLVNLAIALQLEWNKFHTLLNKHFPSFKQVTQFVQKENHLGPLGLDQNEFPKLKKALGQDWKKRLKNIYHQKLNLHLQLLAGSWIDYSKAVQKWWKNIHYKALKDHRAPPKTIYLVSSNKHSVINLLSGFAKANESKILSFIKKGKPNLYEEYQKIKDKQYFLNQNDFLYYCSRFLKKNLQSPYLKKLHIKNIPPSHYLDINTQIIPLSAINPKNIDPRLKIKKPKKIKNSNALIFNIDYPLGFSAYHVLNRLLEHVKKIKGIYIIGKAAVLNSEIGDIQIPKGVFDEHSQNTYLVNNYFNHEFKHESNLGSVLRNQKSVSVLGTYLQNKALLEIYSKNNFTVIEMENGPYLSAITEATYPQQTPQNTIVDLNSLPFDLGIINYTSDTPYSKAKNLGAHRLTLDGIEPVYLAARAVLQRIIDLEESS